MGQKSASVVALVYNAGGLFHTSREHAYLHYLNDRSEAYAALDLLGNALAERSPVVVARCLDVDTHGVLAVEV